MQYSTSVLVTKDKLNLHSECWPPGGEPKAAICLVHGLGEHVGRWHHVCAFLADCGYAVVNFDLRGHGKSGGPLGHSPSYDAVLDDIGLALDQAASLFPGRPLFLYGHSLGGNLVISYAMRRQPGIAGVVATAPLLRTGTPPAGWKLTMGKLMYKVAPGFTMPNGIDRNNLSQDTTVVEAYNADPLVHDKVSARFALDFLKAGEWALDNAPTFPLPLLLMQGSADRLVSLDANRLFAEKVGRQCTLRVWDGLYHEIHNEPAKDQVLAYLVSWLDATCAAPRA